MVDPFFAGNASGTACAGSLVGRRGTLHALSAVADILVRRFPENSSSPQRNMPKLLSS
jgi:hypothetical protein